MKLIDSVIACRGCEKQSSLCLVTVIHAPLDEI